MIEVNFANPVGRPPDGGALSFALVLQSAGLFALLSGSWLNRSRAWFSQPLF
jgi:hypothetical protein